MRLRLGGVCVVAALLAWSGAAAQQPRRTIFLPKIDGFEQYVAGALKNLDVPVDVVTDEGKADLKGDFTPAGSALIYNKSGRYPEDILEVDQADSKRTLLLYRFFLMDDPGSRSRAAVEFAQELRKKLEPKRRRERDSVNPHPRG
jgi:hypothetical protein